MRALCLVAPLALVACTSTPAGTPPPPEPVSYGAVGSLVGDAGKGRFRFGASSAATQIEDQNDAVDWAVWTAPEAEGGLGKGEDPLGDASRGYTLAIEDVGLLTELGVDSYRFSMDWARIEPERNVIDEEALAHYDALLDALVAAGIRPMVTIHHFSNPVWVDDPRAIDCAGGPTDQNLCGWNHPEGAPLVLGELDEHVRLLAERFGDRVDEWCTVNEPINYMLAGYGIGNFPPGKSGIFNPLEELVPMARNYVAAHVVMYDALHEVDVVDADDDGEPALVGIPHAVGEWVPARDNQVSTHPDDVAAVERLKWVYHYLFIESVLQGRFDADLDGEMDEDHPEWAGKLDWLGVQYYFRTGVTGLNGLVPVLELTPCFETFDFGACIPPLDETNRVPEMGYEHHPDGLYQNLSDLSQRWPELPLVVTESGMATNVGRRRAEMIVRALEAIEKARGEGADVRGYYHWSLYDNFEWAYGYGPRFGLYRVDYDTYERTPTEGATLLGDVARARLLTSEQRAELGGDGPFTPEE